MLVNLPGTHLLLLLVITFSLAETGHIGSTKIKKLLVRREKVERKKGRKVRNQDWPMFIISVITTNQQPTDQDTWLRLGSRRTVL